LTAEWIQHNEITPDIMSLKNNNMSHLYEVVVAPTAIVQKNDIYLFNQCCHIKNYYIRDGPFNFQVGGYGFFSKNIFWFPMLLKKIFWFWWGKKKSDSEFLSYNLMLISGKKNSRLARQKKNSNSRVVRKKISERNKKL
jgi:hypothetical protein